MQAEDKRAFHQRIADAKASREEAEARLRHMIYVDSLTVEEVRSLLPGLGGGWRGQWGSVVWLWPWWPAIWLWG